MAALWHTHAGISAVQQQCSGTLTRAFRQYNSSTVVHSRWGQVVRHAHVLQEEAERPQQHLTRGSSSIRSSRLWCCPLNAPFLLVVAIIGRLDWLVHDLPVAALAQKVDFACLHENSGRGEHYLGDLLA